MRRLALLFLTALITLSVAAQFHPNEDRGFTPDKVYRFSDIDHVNGFNGNLVLTVPVGESYKVRGQLPYGLTLVYNSNIWDFLLVFGQMHDNPYAYYESVPSGHANAGLGWELTFGRLMPPDDPLNESVINWIYESPDGASHVMYSGDQGATGLSSDGTYLRMRSSGSFRYIDWPDGRTYTFSDRGTGSTHDWRVDAFNDPFGNSVTITYSTPTGYADLWSISDSEGRSQKVYFIDATDTTYGQRLVQRIESTTAAGVTATYSFDYALRTIDRSPKDGSNNGQRGAPIAVRFLRSVSPPKPDTGAAGTSGSFGFPTPGDTSADPAPYYNVTGDYSGMIRGLQLPTRGWLEWDYTGIIFPAPSANSRLRTHTYGVAQRRMYDASRTLLGTWDYKRINGNTVTCSTSDPLVCDPRPTCLAGGARQMVSILTSPPYSGTTRASAVTYYSIFSDSWCANTEGWALAEYSAPLTHAVAQDGRSLSTEVRDAVDLATLPSQIDGQMQSGTLERSQYVKYEYDGDASVSGDNNRRQSSSRTNYEDDAAGCGATCYVSEDLFSWTGHGRYRQTSTRSNFPQLANRTTFTNYPSTNSSAWLFNTYSEQCVRDDTTTEIASVTTCDGFGGFITKYNFDPVTGLLLGRRTFAGDAPGAGDLLAVFTYHSSGNVLSEKYYGGDDASQALSTTDLFTPQSSPAYDIEHSYTFTGSALTKHSAKYAAETFKAIDEDFGPAGNLKAVRDTAGVQTDLTYDARGRLIQSKPTATTGLTRGGWTKYIYSDATASARATVGVQHLDTPGTVLAEESYEFDDLGRLVNEGRHMPDTATNTSNWSYHTTEYDILGRKTKTSDVAPSPSHYTEFSYDLFDRPISVKAPDTSTTTFSYLGAREADRTSSVAVAQAATETSVVQKQFYDAAGRLAQVKEKSGPTTPTTPTGAEITTDYTYDAANHLVSVSTTGSGKTQHRYFTYDGRGFLNSEQHPETGVTGNATTSYTYDSRGHALSKVTGPTDGVFDLRMTYDDAERLTQITEPDPASANSPKDRRPVKQFDFGTSGFALGKALNATRFNYLGGSYGTVKVVESYIYAGRDGSASQRTTTVSRTDVSQAIQTFTTGFSTNELGGSATITYPFCTSCGSPELALSNTYSRGFLTGAGSFGTLTYSDNGTVNTVTHGFVTDTYTPDSSGMPRPQSITFTGWTSCSISASVTAPGSVCPNSTGNAASVNATTGATYNWTITGGTITSGQGTASIRFTAGASGQVALSATVTVTCGSSTASATTSIDTVTATVSGSTTINPGGSATIQAVLAGTAPWSVVWSDGYSQTNVTSSPATRVVSPAATTTYFVSTISDATCTGSASGTATVTVNPPPPRPTGVTATRRGTQNIIDVTWTSTGADSYVIQRTYNNGPITEFAGIVGSSWADTDPQIASGGVVTYVYYVIGVKNSVRSAASIPDIATVIAFTNDPLVQYTTTVSGVHVSQLRQAIDAVRRSAGLALIWGTYPPATGTIYAWTFYEAQPTWPRRDMFNALNDARVQLGIAPVAYAAGNEPIAGRIISRTHVETLRAGVK